VKWDDLRIIGAVGEQGSFSGAARVLGLDASSVSRRMRELEERSGVRLFERMSNSLALTPAGEDLSETARRMAEEADAADRRLSGRDTELRGVVRFATLDSTARNLMPALQRFSTQYPEIELEVVVDNNPANLSRREADVVLRVTRHPPQALVGRRIARHVFPVYGAPALIERIGADAPLERYPWVGWENGLTQEWMDRHQPHARIVLRANTAMGVEEAVRAGIGIGHIACFGADSRPGLRRLLPPDPDLDIDQWLLVHPDMRRSARIRAFVQHLTREFEAQRDLIEGRRGPASLDS
jgi:DNA-binding transcriptional LysR family regulator